VLDAAIVADVTAAVVTTVIASVDVYIGYCGDPCGDYSSGC